jgi:hypothetical protein
MGRRPALPGTAKHVNAPGDDYMRVGGETADVYQADPIAA